MLSVKVTGIDNVRRQIDSGYRDLLESLATDLTRELQEKTPVKTGRAQAGWDKQVGKEDFVIENKVPYVGYLEKPYVKSRQAPRGIIGPALDSIKGKYK